MVLRVVFAFSWAVVRSMFPIAAETGSRNERDDYGVLGISLLLVLAICSVFVGALFLAPNAIWSWLFGKQFAAAGGIDFSHLLPLYAASNGIYALSPWI